MACTAVITPAMRSVAAMLSSRQATWRWFGEPLSANPVLRNETNDWDWCEHDAENHLNRFHFDGTDPNDP